MKEYIRIIKDWAKISKPSKLWMSATFACLMCYHLCILISPIFAAKLTLALTGGQYNTAMLFLVVIFGVMALMYLSLHLNYMVFAKLIRHIYSRLNNDIMAKILNAKSKNFESTSKEMIMNIVHTDAYTMAEFGDRLATGAARTVGLIITLIIIFIVNAWAGFIVVVAGIINYFVLNWINGNRAVYVKKLREHRDYQYAALGRAVDSRFGIRDLGIENKVKKDFNKILDNYAHNLHKRTFWDSMIDAFFPVFYHLLILVATILLVLLVAGKGLPLETYFIIVAYITSGIETTNRIYTLLPQIRTAGISTARIKTLLSFVEYEDIKFGDHNLTEIMGNITFNNVSYGGDDEYNPQIRNINLSLTENQTHLIYGTTASGKRTIFNLLRRAIVPSQGTVLCDGINIFDYTNNSHLDNFCYVTNNPVFLKGSILKNLRIKEKSKKVIVQACKEVGIYDYIDSLPKKFATPINSLPYSELYALGFVRAILSGTEVMVIYEIPNKINNSEKQAMLNIIQKMHGTRTIILFSGQTICSSIVDSITEIEQGKIKSQKTRN